MAFNSVDTVHTTSRNAGFSTLRFNPNHGAYRRSPFEDYPPILPLLFLNYTDFFSAKTGELENLMLNT